MSPVEISMLMESVLPYIVALASIGAGGRIISAWLRNRGGAAPKELRVISEQLAQLQHAVDTMAVEVERIEEAQRFNARLLSEGRRPDAPDRERPV